MADPLAFAVPDVSLDATITRLLPVVGGWCRRLGGPGVDAEEAATDVLLVVARKWDALDDHARIEPWVFAVTRRVIARHRRRVWWRRWLPGGIPEGVADGSTTPGARHQAAERAARVGRVLERLPEAQREVLVLSAIEERTDVEVAELLGLPVGTVKSRLRLARERFRAIVASEPGLADLAEVHDG